MYIYCKYYILLNDFIKWIFIISKCLNKIYINIQELLLQTLLNAVIFITLYLIFLPLRENAYSCLLYIVTQLWELFESISHASFAYYMYNIPLEEWQSQNSSRLLPWNINFSWIHFFFLSFQHGSTDSCDKGVHNWASGFEKLLGDPKGLQSFAVSHQLY